LGYYDFKTKKTKNEFINPKEVDEIILTRSSKISTDIYKLNPKLTIICFKDGKPIATLIPINNLPKILKNEKLFSKLSKYKRNKIAWIFCKAVCSSRIKIISRLNETRKNSIVKEALISMRELDLKLSKAKTKNEMMGYEGNVAKIFYFCLSEFNDLFVVNRNRESRDIVNVLMNLGHTILREKVKTRIIVNGLNPYHQFLHGREGRNEQYLTWDFSEFWIPYVDKLIFYALERGIISEDDVDNDGRLKMIPKNKFINLINKRITTEKIDKKIKEFKGYLEGKNRFGWK
jgi:CRISPR-associated protein Cas1